MIRQYPILTELTLADRAELDPLFRKLHQGLSELSFAGIYCFAEPHGYRASRLADGTYIFPGSDKGQPFFLAPFSLPRPELFDELLVAFGSLKLASETQAAELQAAGYRVTEDRDSFDYLYRREDLAQLAGRALQKKRNLVNAFEKENAYAVHPLSAERIPDAIAVLDAWRQHSHDAGDYGPAHKTLQHFAELELRGRIYYVENEPAGYTIGEETSQGTMLVVHYEKAIPDIKGLSQFINMDFARTAPVSCLTINREQDLGDPGLRQAKLTYRPVSLLKKFRVFRS